MRHGQTNFNKEKRLTCRYDEDINQTGVEQAILARDAVRNLDLDLIICSPLKRTRHTMELVNVNHVPVIFDDRLLERDGGVLTGTMIDDFYYTEYYNYYSTKHVDGLETLPQLFARVHGFLDEIKIKYQGKNVLLVTHGAVARVIKFYFEALPADGMLLHVSGQKNCEIKTYEL